MPFISAIDAPIFELHGARFTALAAPSRGATENGVWIVTLQRGTPPVHHRLTREETFVCIEGEARAIVDGTSIRLTLGSALVVPPHTDFALKTPADAPFSGGRCPAGWRPRNLRRRATVHAAVGAVGRS